MSLDYHRLFNEGRLQPHIPEHKAQIDAQLAHARVMSYPKYVKLCKMYDVEPEADPTDSAKIEPDEEAAEQKSEDDVTKEDMIKALEKAGVDVDGRWGEKKLKQKYDELSTPKE